MFCFVQKDWLFTVDVKTIAHVLRKDTGAWQKPSYLTYNLLQLLGPGINDFYVRYLKLMWSLGVVLADSDLHRKQV